MKRLLLLIPLLIVGCTNPSTQAFRIQQTAENLAYTAYVGYTNYIATTPIDPSVSNAVREARLRFAATDQLVDSLRLAYDTNALVKSQLEAVVQSLADQSSNVVWTIHFVKGK